MSPMLATLLLSPLAGAGEVRVEKVEYKNFSDSYRISNGTVDLVVVPKLGRVMRYGYVGKDNLLWENNSPGGQQPPAWSNYGGDKLWPAPQSAWNWPPDPDLDGSPWSAEVLANGVRITSRVSKKLKLQLTREITLDPLGTLVHFRNRLDNRGPRREWAPWQVTQVNDPTSIFLPFESVGQNPRGWKLLQGSRLDDKVHEVLRDGIRIRRKSSASFKFGAFSTNGEITAALGRTIFSTSARIYRGQPYADGDSPLQVFTSGDPDKYAELELQAPLARLETGEGSYLDVTWKLASAQ